jgi:hypothetical protein
MGNYVIGAGNYMIATPSEVGNYVIADSVYGALNSRIISAATRASVHRWSLSHP